VQEENCRSAGRRSRTIILLSEIENIEAQQRWTKLALWASGATTLSRPFFVGCFPSPPLLLTELPYKLCVIYF